MDTVDLSGAAAAFAALTGADPPKGLPPGGNEACPSGDRDLAAILRTGPDWRTIRRLQSARWLVQESALRAACRTLSASGIDAWGYKGADYALTLYPDPVLRPMSDIDLIVRPCDMTGAMTALRRGGWEASPHVVPLVTSGIVAVVLLRKGEVILDLHSHPSYFPSTIPGRLPHPAETAGTVTEAGFISPPPPYSLLLTLLHILRHGRGRPVWWLDAALLVSGMEDSDWRKFAYDAVRTGLSSRLADLLRTVQSFSGAAIPHRALELMVAAPDRGRFLDLPRSIPGSGSLAAVVTLRGWRRASFVPALIMKLVTGGSSRRPRESWR